MNFSHIKNFSGKLKKNLKSISNDTARNFLLKNGYAASSFIMPDYYNPIGFNLMKLNKITWNKNLPKVTKTLDVLTPKADLEWRNFNLLNPYIFLHIVKELTRKKNWEFVKKILSQKNLVYSYSTPVFKLKTKEKTKGRAILNWLQMAEKDVIKDCAEYSYLTITDIRNFYPTIYTHSIAWAMHGKSEMKKPINRTNFKFLGNRLDKLFRNSRDGQTNGIPVGSMVSDIIAEIILVDVDNKLSKKIKDDRLSEHVLVCRYRDDYRILSKTEDQGKKVLQNLNKILNIDYGLYINPDKTTINDDIIEHSFRPSVFKINNSNLLRKVKNDDFSDCKNVNYLMDCLIETYRIQKEFPKWRISITILAALAEGLLKYPKKIKLTYSDISGIISILEKITLSRGEATPQAFLLIDVLLKQINNKSKKKKILNAMREVINSKNDKDYQLIWFYRLCLSHTPELCKNLLKKNKIPLLRVINRSYYKHDYEIFDKVDFSSNDKSELKKFTFVDRTKLSHSKNCPIDPCSIKVFKY